jgi:hypothetical protein
MGSEFAVHGAIDRQAADPATPVNHAPEVNALQLSPNAPPTDMLHDRGRLSPP